jgi:hypothetical protein
MYVDSRNDPDASNGASDNKKETLPSWAEERLKKIVRDPIHRLSAADKELCWTVRRSIMDMPLALPKFLLSVDWAVLEHVNEAYQLIHMWEPLEPEHALQLLDHSFPDPKVLLGSITHSLEASPTPFIHGAANRIIATTLPVSLSCRCVPMR